jgi:hypothetical protein
MKHSFEDILDLRPREHGKNDLSILLNPGKHPYDAATVLLGTIWHDILQIRDDFTVRASWDASRKLEGVTACEVEAAGSESEGGND